MKTEKEIRQVIRRIEKKEKLKYNTKYDIGFKKALNWVLSSKPSFHPYDKYDESK